MAAELVIDQRFALPDGAIIQIKVWRLPEPVPPSPHRLKYSLFYGRPGERIVGYDNERGKGDHKHINGLELPYAFKDVATLIRDFLHDIKEIEP